MNSITFSVLFVGLLSWGSPHLIGPKNWKAQKSSLPSISKQFKGTYGYSEVEISYTKFGVPKINSSEQFKSYLMSQYPKQPNGFPKVKVTKIQNCALKRANCWIALIDVKLQSSHSWVIIQYFKDRGIDYQGMSMIPQNKDSKVLANRIMKEMADAISK